MTAGKGKLVALCFPDTSGNASSRAGTKNGERTMKKLLFVALVVAAAAAGGFWYWKSQAKPSTGFAFAEVRRGRLEATVGSTGTLQPREIVDVGAQVVGRIVSIGRDPKTQS